MFKLEIYYAFQETPPNAIERFHSVSSCKSLRSKTSQDHKRQLKFQRPSSSRAVTEARMPSRRIVSVLNVLSPPHYTLGRRRIKIWSVNYSSKEKKNGTSHSENIIVNTFTALPPRQPPQSSCSASALNNASLPHMKLYSAHLHSSHPAANRKHPPHHPELTRTSSNQAND